MLVEIDDEKLNHSVNLAIEKVSSLLFFEGSYGKEPGVGYYAVQDAVKKYISTVDMTPQIKSAVAEKLDVLIKNVVETMLLAKIKKTAKELEKDGKLFEKVS